MGLVGFFNQMGWQADLPLPSIGPLGRVNQQPWEQIIKNADIRTGKNT